MRKSWLAICCATLGLLATGASARAATDPLFVFTPFPPPQGSEEPNDPPPTARLEGPCGLGVDSSGLFYVSDYYHDAVDAFSPNVSLAKPWQSYVTQIAKEDPLDGPCGLALDSSNHLYVNNFHRNVVRYGILPSFGTGTVFPLPAEDTAHHLPTGVAVGPEDRVYVDNRTYISVYNSSGTPVLDGEGHPLKIGKGSLEDGYGVAVSAYSGTEGRLYVPDAGSNTVKVYDPAISATTPLAQIKNPSGKPFVSLRDSAIAVDRVSGEIYFADNDQPEYTERPQATIYDYTAANVYGGHLKYNVIDALPPGLAVDNSALSTQGRVYVTSGNAGNASVYAYGPGSSTFIAPLPPLGTGLQAPGSGGTLEATPPSPQGALSSQAPPAGGTASASVIAQHENIRLNVESRLSPKRLPRKGTAPIAVTVEWQISTADGSPPPKLKTLSVAINKEGRLDTEGLPTCPYAKIQPASTQRALSNCRSSLVGRGTFGAEIALKGQEEAQSYEAKGQLLLFNGKEGGKQVLFGQIYSAHPFATSFVIPFHLTERKKGTYGTVLSAKLPAALRSWGNLNAIEMKLQRRYGANGKRHSFLSAGCPAPKGFGLASFKLARTAFSFSGGEKLATTVTGECRVRG